MTATRAAPTSSASGAGEADTQWQRIVREVRSTIESESTRSNGFVLVSLAAPNAAPTALLRALASHGENNEAMCFQRGNAGWCAIGAVARCEPNAQAAKSLMARVATVALDNTGVSRARVVGGAAFTSVRSLAGTPWEPFPERELVLSRWLYVAGALPTLMLVVPMDTSAPQLEAMRSEFEQVWATLSKASSHDARTSEGVVPRAALSRNAWVGAIDRDAWCARVQEVTQRISDGAFRKVVVARHREAKLRADNFDAVQVVERLAQSYPGCTAFLLRRADAVFLGATPELLVSTEASMVRSEALAGSARKADSSMLLASTKDLEEHRVVVDTIVRVLKEHVSDVEVPPKPVLREIGDVVHMHTPIEAKNSASVHLLDLVNALHPTPAVGGVPTDAALDWINANEPTPRGWYASPIGWVDNEGDGEFVVALRSGVVHNGVVWTYAGAGIMGDSVPSAEFEETEMKMQALWGALCGDA